MRRVLLTTIIICVTIVQGSLFGNVNAAAIEHLQARVDNSIAKEDKSYNIPRRIVVVPIFPPAKDFTLQANDWFRGLYYFTIANENRPGFTDIPFHYIVTASGKSFVGNSGGEERKISIQGLGDDMVVIGYLANPSDNSFDPRSRSELASLIIEVANRNAITPDKVFISAATYVRDSENQAARLEKRDIFGLWQGSLNEVVASVKKKYVPKAKTYELAVSAIELPTKQVEPGTIATGKITIENKGKFGVYAGTLSEVVGTKSTGGNSLFYITTDWLSTTQFGLMPSDGLLLPGSKATFSFKLGVPLYMGVQTEKFHLRNVAGTKLEGTDFKVSLDIKRPEGIIVEVGATETGWLRVRSAPSGFGNNEIARVSTGQRFFQLDEQSNGWVKIKLNDGREGWVSKFYLNYL